VDHVEPVTCSVCGRKFPPKFAACIYCKAARPDFDGEGASESAAKLVRATVRPVPAAGIAPPPAVVPVPPIAASAANAPRMVIPLVPVDDAPGTPVSTWIRVAFGFVALVGAIYAIATMYARYRADRIELWVVNTTGTSGMSLVIDSKVITENIPSTLVESPSSARNVVITPGAHTLEAREANGLLIATASIDVAEESPGVLFVPKRAQETCFAVERTEYGAGADQRITPFDIKREAWEMTSTIDFWFAPNPKALSVASGTGTVVRRAVRQMPCAAFEAGVIRRGSAAAVGTESNHPVDAGVEAP
jgi:hypothetical protein